MLALTLQFKYCYPGRIEDINGHCKIKHGHKHLIWFPDEPHTSEILVEKEIDNLAISEIPTDVKYEDLILPKSMFLSNLDDIKDIRKHLQIRIDLYLI